MDAICKNGVTFMLSRKKLNSNFKLKQCIDFSTNHNIESDTEVINLGTMKLDLEKFKEEYVKEINSSVMLCSMMKERIDAYKNEKLTECAKTWHSFAFFEQNGKFTMIDITDKFRCVLSMLNL